MEKKKAIQMALKITESVLEVLKDELTDDKIKMEKVKVKKNEKRNDKKSAGNGR
ncbi:MAG: hypothetical protein IPH11_15485 [Ignavibacteriales bacterium]|nr:hypothetical protein [Ignavibacteriales bacterium]